MRSIYSTFLVFIQELHVIYATGEVSSNTLVLRRWQRPRSSTIHDMKGAKYLTLINISISQVRSYSTKNKRDSSVIVQLQEEHSKEFERLVKH